MKKVIRLHAEWCGPCKMYEPIFIEETKDLKDWEVISLDIDTDEGRKVAVELGVRGVPTTVIMIDGETPKFLAGLQHSEDLKKVLV